MSSPASELRIARSPSGVEFWIHVSPRSRHEGVGGVRGDSLRVAVSAPPVEGKANAACIRALAKALGQRTATIELDPSSKGRRKRVTVRGDPDSLTQRLHALAANDRLR